MKLDRSQVAAMISVLREPTTKPRRPQGPRPPAANPRFRLAGLLATHQPAPITLAAVSLSPITDADLGMPEDPVAQTRAEEFVAAFAARRLRDQEAGRRSMPTNPVAEKKAAPAAPPMRRKGETVPPVRVTVPDDAMILIDPTDSADDVEAAILAELRRLSEGSRSRNPH